MNSVNVFKEWKSSGPRIENVVLFVSDALRWDYLPHDVAGRGVAFKTVASSLFTASSFPSIVSGLYPYHHGVYTFFHTIPRNLVTLLNLPGYNCTFWTVDLPGSSAIHRVLRSTNPIPLDKLEPPFIYLEDEKGGHCPYGWTEEDENYAADDCIKFFRDYGRKSNKELLESYKAGIERSVREFNKRMEVLAERNLLDHTLVVFLSDHGELLGEYGGIIAHENLTTPEVVYVPTVFIHPDLPKGHSYEAQGVLRHVDLLPTILDLLNIKLAPQTDGVNLCSIDLLPQTGNTYWEKRIRKRPLRIPVSVNIIEKSVWDQNGGYLFREGVNLLQRLLSTLYSTTLSNGIQPLYWRGKLWKKPIHTAWTYPSMLKNYSSSRLKYGRPVFTFKEAKMLIDEVGEDIVKPVETDRVKSRIKDLKTNRKVTLRKR